MVRNSGKDAARPAAAILVIPPRDVMRDELRLARLADYLDAAFPGLDVTVSEDPRLAGRNPAAGLVRRPGEAHPLQDARTAATVDRVLAAVQDFVDYGSRRH